MRGLIVGNGKMGRAIETALIARGHEVVGRLNRAAFTAENVHKLERLKADVAFEFTAPEAAASLNGDLLSHRIPVVSGTTGWNTDVIRVLAEDMRVPFLHAPNFSIGVAVLGHAVAAAARELAAFPEFEPGIVERHHSAKKDAVSGTAKLLADIISSARPSRNPVPVVSLRQGGQPGEHMVIFEGQDEVIEIVHRARSRAIFAMGAVRAGEWLISSGIRGPATFDDFLLVRHFEKPRKLVATAADRKTSSGLRRRKP